MALVAIKIGRRPGQGRRREHIWIDTRSRGCGTAGLFSSQPFGAGPVGCFSTLLAPHVSISDMLVINASPARTVLKNSQLTPRPRGQSHAISGIGHLERLLSPA
jgi:hypothetical protein